MSKQRSPATVSGAGKAEATASMVLPNKAVSTGSKAARGSRPPKADAWTEVASFVINFERRASSESRGPERRITAHKMQDGGITAAWTGLAQQPMCQWIAEHVSDWANVDPADAAERSAMKTWHEKAVPAPHRMPKKADDHPEASPSIAAVRAHQTGVVDVTLRANAPRALLGVALKPDEAFDLDTWIDMPASCLGALDPGTPQCTVLFFGKNTQTHEGLRLGAAVAEARNAGDHSFMASLPEIKLPAGSYRVAVVAELNGLPERRAYGQGPLLEIG
jgi:hypothetical protein